MALLRLKLRSLGWASPKKVDFGFLHQNQKQIPALQQILQIHERALQLLTKAQLTDSNMRNPTFLVQY